MSKIYAGIGSRDIDSKTEDLIFRIGKALAKEGWTLSSGGATGCDFAFERGCDEVNGSKTIYLPWKKFGHKWNRKPCKTDIIGPTKEAIILAKELAKEYPKEYNALLGLEKQGKDWNWLFVGRSMHQVLGRDLVKPVNNVVCYTRDGEDIGGTRWALRMARKHKIKIYNIGNPKIKEKFEKWLTQIEI